MTALSGRPLTAELVAELIGGTRLLQPHVYAHPRIADVVHAGAELVAVDAVVHIEARFPPDTIHVVDRPYPEGVR